MFAESSIIDVLQGSKYTCEVKALSLNPTNWSDIPKQFVGCYQRIVWVCLTILWGWHSFLDFKNYSWLLQLLQFFFFPNIILKILWRYSIHSVTQNTSGFLLFELLKCWTLEAQKKVWFSENFWSLNFVETE